MKLHFIKLINSISLSSYQRDIVVGKHNSICKGLAQGFYNSYYWENKRLLVGSYAKGTVIQPGSDLDILFILPNEEYKIPTYRNVQSYILQKVKNNLHIRYEEKSKGDGQVVVIRYGDGTVAEILPAFEKEDGTFLSLDTNNGGSYKHINPRWEIKNIDKSNNITNGNTKKLIKIIKRWKKYCNVEIKSLVIEFRMINFLKTHYLSSSDEGSYAIIIADFFKELLKYENGTIDIPLTGETINYGNKWINKAKTASDIARLALEYENNGNFSLAISEWRKLFGYKFNSL